MSAADIDPHRGFKKCVGCRAYTSGKVRFSQIVEFRLVPSANRGKACTERNRRARRGCRHREWITNSWGDVHVDVAEPQAVAQPKWAGMFEDVCRKAVLEQKLISFVTSTLFFHKYDQLFSEFVRIMKSSRRPGWSRQGDDDDGKGGPRSKPPPWSVSWSVYSCTPYLGFIVEDMPAIVISKHSVSIYHIRLTW